MSAPTGRLRLINAVRPEVSLTARNWNQPRRATDGRAVGDGKPVHTGYWEFRDTRTAIAFAARRGIRIVEGR